MPIEVFYLGIVFATIIRWGSDIMGSIDEKILNMVKEDTIAALGCTEPVAVAYAAASLNKFIDEDIKKMSIDVSLNIFKNGKSVYIPKTSSMGLDLAALLGYLCGDVDDDFLVLQHVREEDIKKAENLIESGLVDVNCLEDRSDIFVGIELETDNHIGKVILENSHTNIKTIVLDGKIMYQDDSSLSENGNIDFLRDMSFRDFRHLIEDVDIRDIEFLLEGVEMNKKVSKKGLEEKTGLGIGYALNNMEKSMKREMDPVTRVRIMTAAAADARMSGKNCPVMTSGGSGNQGLGVFLPISIVGESESIEEDRMVRAIYFGHIVNRYVKIYTGKLSSLCGCAIASCIGAAAAITWMLGGDDRQIEGACNTIFANLTGMICDGAKDSCSLKLATSAAEAVIASYLSLENVYPNKNIGIVGESVEETIRNLGLLRREGLKDTDKTIVRFI